MPLNDMMIPSAEMKDLFPGTDDQYWNALRHKGGGPVYTKCGRKVYYLRSDVEAWVESNRYTRTDRPVA
ncbi:hypothetical protein BMG05_19800 [Mycobacterium malmoense]|nr:hypothetical protein BMG05_19800 [Mycobacterium malmoense]